MRNLCRNLARKLQGKKQLRRPRPKWKYDIKMYVRKIGCEEWTGLALSQCRYLQRTTQTQKKRKWKDINALSGI
jgi:hypothetical protein